MFARRLLEKNIRENVLVECVSQEKHIILLLYALTAVVLRDKIQI